LKHCEFSKFPKLNEKMIRAMDDVLSTDIPKLMKQFPQEASSPENPFASSNPFEGGGSGGDELSSSLVVDITQDDRIRWADTFNGLNPGADGKISGGKARPVMVESGLPRETLSQVWKLSDHDADGFLNLDEFIVCMWLLRFVSQGNEAPLSWSDIPAAVRNVDEGNGASVVDDDFAGDPFGDGSSPAGGGRPQLPPKSESQIEASAPPMTIRGLDSDAGSGASGYGDDNPWPET
jgi:Cytoskeletal-regulatory complex EF hand